MGAGAKAFGLKQPPVMSRTDVSQTFLQDGRQARPLFKPLWISFNQTVNGWQRAGVSEKTKEAQGSVWEARDRL